VYFYFFFTCALSVVLSIYDVWLSVLCFQVFHLATICYILSRWFLVLFCIETTLNAPGFVEGIRVAHLLSCLCCAIMCFYALCSVLWSPLRFTHSIDVRFVVTGTCCRLTHVLRYFCLFGYSGFRHILCCVFALFFFVLCTLCCQSLCIVIFDCPFGVL
jgi:hypothetical protein